MTDTTNTQTEGPMEAWLSDQGHTEAGCNCNLIPMARKVDAQLREAIAQRDAAEANAQNLSRLRAGADAANMHGNEVRGTLARQLEQATERSDRLAEALRRMHYFLDGFMPQPADHERVVEYDAKRNPWVQCSSNEQGHMEGQCPQDVDDDEELIPSIPFGELRAVMDAAAAALAGEPGEA